MKTIEFVPPQAQDIVEIVHDAVVIGSNINQVYKEKPKPAHRLYANDLKIQHSRQLALEVEQLIRNGYSYYEAILYAIENRWDEKLIQAHNQQ